MWLFALFALFHAAAAIVARPPPPSSHELPHTYLIRFKDNTPAHIRDNHIQSIRDLEKDHPNVGIRHVFSLAFDGYSAVLNDATLEKVRHADEVVSIDHVGLSAERPRIPDHFSNHDQLQQQVTTVTNQ